MKNILVAHGALGSATQMQPIIDAFRAIDDGLRVEVLEFPGHGQTSLAHDEDFRLPSYVGVMAQSLAQFDAPPVLFGYSMGGYVGLALQAQSPNSFAGIVTLGTKFEWTPETAEREAGRLDPVVIANKIPRFAQTLEARHERAGGWEAVVLRTATLLRENGQAPLLSVEVLERIAIPVCVAVGTKDETVSVEESQRAADVMLRGTCAPLAEVGHPIERVPVNLVVDLLLGLRA